MHVHAWSDDADEAAPMGATATELRPGDVLLDTYLMYEPQSLKRHRHLMRGGTYDPSKRDKQAFAAQLALSPRVTAVPYSGPIQCQLFFYCSRPQSHFGTRRGQKYLKPSAPIWNTNPKDLDNMTKFVLDALNGQLYADDRQIVQIECRKLYADPAVCSTSGYMYIYFRALPLDHPTMADTGAIASTTDVAEGPAPEDGLL